MRFDAVEEFLDESLTLPIKGKDGKVREYSIPPPTAGELIRIKAMHQLVDDEDVGQKSAAGDLEAVNGLSQREIANHALSESVVQAMIDDGVPAALFDRAMVVGLFFRNGDVETARRVWSGKAQSPKTLLGKDGDADQETSTASTPGTSTRKKSSKR